MCKGQGLLLGDHDDKTAKANSSPVHLCRSIVASECKPPFGSEMATPGRPPAYSRTVTTELVMPQHSAPDGLCLAGVVFKWIDMCAVMCAEKHAATPCVTVGIDDVRLLTEARVGEVVRLEAVVAAVWKSSMAIEVCVDVENPMAGTVARLCNCHTTFVVKPDATGKKPSLPPLQLETDADRARQVHAERRKAYRMQIRPREDKTPLPLGLQHAPLGASPRGGKTPGASQCLSTHLVMPPDANHNGTTFGGCIMAWAGEAAYIAASRHCRTAVACESLDAVSFLGPSYVGEYVTVCGHVHVRWASGQKDPGACRQSAEVMVAGDSAFSTCTQIHPHTCSECMTTVHSLDVVLRGRKGRHAQNIRTLLQCEQSCRVVMS